jgi:NAD(P)-dependent dehydrogenase (short-subunit alcohol dehydrogenase family)
MGSLTGKRALVTGGASGIGRATALLFAHEGAAVAVADVNQASGQAVVHEIQEAGGTARFYRCDVSIAKDCQWVVERTVANLGGLEILFNGAGVIRRASVVETSEEEWDQIMDFNVKSVFLMSKQAVPIMAEGGGGVIINMGSGWGLIGGRQAAAD